MMKLGKQAFFRGPGVRAGAALSLAAMAAGGFVQAQTTNDAAAPLAPVEVRPRTESLTVTADYLIGLGNITLPVGYALPGREIGRSVISFDRNSSYYGASASWQINASLGFDVSFSQGSSTGTFPFYPEAGGGRFPQDSINSQFKLDDTWVQAYLRYRLKRFSGTRLGVFLRGGMTYVDAKYDGISGPPNASYLNEGKIQDITANVGFGLDYRIANIGKIRTRAVFEGEGFGGIRSRNFTETTVPFSGQNKLDDTVYGGLGRILLRGEYTFGRDGQWRSFLEGGVQARWTEEMYGQPSSPILDNSSIPISNAVKNSTQSELLWGPYVRAGLRYSF